MPEVFEYDFEPDVVATRRGAVQLRPRWRHMPCRRCVRRLLVRCPLAVGDRVAFKNAGAYTLTKAHMFNGVDLPAIYALTESGELQLKKEFGYGTFADR